MKVIAGSDIRTRVSTDCAALDTSSKVLLLARLADWLTLMARDTYDSDGGVADPARLRAFNEAQNRILAQLVRLLTGDHRRYPDNVFANMVVDQFDTLQLDAADLIRLAEECTGQTKQFRRAGRQSRTSKAAAALHRLR
jgi:hypothetical protein